MTIDIRGLISARKRSATPLDMAHAVEFGHFNCTEFPLVIAPRLPGVVLASWVESHRPLLEQELLKHGAILFRGFDVPSAAQFGRVAAALCENLLEYVERAAKRREVAPRVFTSTELAPDQVIPLHHEMSFAHRWPTKIVFYCSVAPAIGGRTPIASDRRVLPQLSNATRRAFEQLGVLYLRNYRPELEPWQEAFQTQDPALVERYCREGQIEYEWLAGDRLRTRRRGPAIMTHPATGEAIWFNHAHMFHVSNMSSALRESLLATYAEDELPRNALFGDGTPIPVQLLDEVRGVYERTAVSFDWQVGDVLMLDNVLASHGRETFSGPREILVAMSDDPSPAQQLQTALTPRSAQ